MSEIRTDTINNASGDNDSGIDLSTNDVVAIKTGNTERLRINDDGNILVGRTTELNDFGDGRTSLVLQGSGSEDYSTIQLANNGTGSNNQILGLVAFYDGTNENARIQAQRGDGTDVGDLHFSTRSSGGSLTEHMRLYRNGSLGVGTTEPVGRIHVNVPNLGNLDGIRIVNSTNNTGGYFIRFQNSSGVVAGAVEQNGTSTVSYNTSSDYRLKENIVTMSGAIDRVKQLLPKRFNFIADGTDTVVDGFLAHEAQTVVPEAISGTHNGLEVWKEGEELPDGVSVGDNKLDEDGNTIPKYQGIDQSKLVPLLTGALKEAIAKIEALEARIEALENA